ncbi:uncharacterized protein TNCT_371881 [Trichonephila clavata]|uniref:Uncharacterized protein n=1 Tax=Trichonephila clavata TaxID=2740835 RepID=A0A8X6HV71_TRICU|nr:uncharacterized protein TNCT_371881 [Trichonephila clavata]
MESNIAILCLCCLIALSQGFSYNKPRTSYSVPGNYLNDPSDQEVEFLRLLLSRYEADSPNYANPDELYGDENSLLSNYEFPLDQEDAGNLSPISPSQQPVQEFSEDKVTTETSKETNMVTTPSTTTTDGLASVPPASREKGQKEYAMLRPPVDNHKKIEHWMKLMNENKLALDRNGQQYRQPVGVCFSFRI